METPLEEKEQPRDKVIHHALQTKADADAESAG